MKSKALTTNTIAAVALEIIIAAFIVIITLLTAKDIDEALD